MSRFVSEDDEVFRLTVCFGNHVVNAILVDIDDVRRKISGFVGSSKLKQIYAINNNKTQNCSKKYAQTDLHLRSLETFIISLF